MTNLKVIIRPVITEKSSSKTTEGKHVFEVQKSARKPAIKQAIEEIYGIKVTDIKTHIIPQKVRIFGRNRVLTKRPVTKRAIVSIEKGKTLDPFKIKQK
jgi:large subunit ribosomal protein L23